MLSLLNEFIFISNQVVLLSEAYLYIDMREVSAIALSQSLCTN